MGHLQGRSRNFRGGMGCKAPALVNGVVAFVLAGAIPVRVNALQSATAASTLVLDGTTVVDVEQGKLLPAQRVVIVGNRIQKVGPINAVSLPKGAQVVNARGKYLIPGLWDMHVHPNWAAADFFYPLFTANGVTGIRDGGSWVGIKSQVQWRHEILAGARVGPPRQLLTSSFGGTYDGLISDIGHGMNFLKIYVFDFAQAALARRAGVPFGGHVKGIAATVASDSGARIIDHFHPAAAGGLDTLCSGPTGSTERCERAAQHLLRNGTWFVPTLLRLPLTAQQRVAPRSRPVVVRSQEFARKFWAGSMFDGYWLRDTVRVDMANVDTSNTTLLGSPADSLGILHIAQRVGLPLLVGTDAVSMMMKRLPPGFALHAELAMSVSEGLTPLRALQTATLNPAKLLRGTDSLGTVAAGKLADLVLLDANPLADITNTTSIRAVVTNGRYFDRRALDSLLAGVQAMAKRYDIEKEAFTSPPKGTP